LSRGSPDRRSGEPQGSPDDDDRGGFLSPAVTETLWLFALALAAAIILRAFVGQAFFIPSESMTPQLEVGDRVVVSKISYRLHDPRRGDVVVFDCPEAAGCVTVQDDASLPIRVVRAALETVGLRQPSTEEYIKRVIGLPGETVEGRDGIVYVNGQRVVEPYLPEEVETSTFDPVTVPEGSLWVMGDNRGNSQDSRRFGPIPSDTVVGRAVARIWPPGRAAYL
jgi:signal peptidase I